MWTKRLGIVALLITVLAPLGCQAASFDKRLASAEAFLSSRKGEPYAKWTHEHVAPRTTPILQKCLESIEGIDKTGFMLVADIGPSGKMSNIDAQPSTNLARCVSHALEAEAFEKPPSRKDGGTFPAIFDLGEHP